ncbi:MAG: 30S ribosomal protein S3, partial [Candidatus Bathyarchaeia archaeon]
MPAIKRFMKDSIERLKVDELLRKELRDSGYGGITMTKTPMGTQITLYTMRPGRVIGKRGQTIKELSARLEKDLGIPNPQIAVVEVEVPELDAFIMASRIAMAIERGVHYRRSIFWAARRIMGAGALGVEILIKGKIRSGRSRYEVVREGFIPKSGQPALEQVKTATIPVKLKQGIQGITVTIVPPDAKFPDKISL